jgi:hypothetical protein
MVVGFLTHIFSDQDLTIHVRKTLDRPYYPFFGRAIVGFLGWGNEGGRRSKKKVLLSTVSHIERRPIDETSDKVVIK